ncbi:MAG: LD-carboxypeptidase [Blautia sp.]|nr:LD-carboxypeptidase [Blautia sp.]
MKIPKYIRPGDTIGLVAPSFGATIEPYVTRLEAAISNFEKKGYHVRTAPSCYKSDGLGISTNPADAAKDVMDFYLDEGIDAVISVGGGELMNETISHLDFAKLGAAAPKWYLGYSDNTNFLFPMAALYDIPGIYGPCATGFGKKWEQTEADSFAILEGREACFGGYRMYELPDDETRSEDPLAPYHLTQNARPLVFLPDNGQLKPSAENEVQLEGRLMGGCLDVLENLAGTRFDGSHAFAQRYKKEGIIWMLEACDLSPMMIRRTIWHLKMQGWFEHASGFLIGRPLAAFGVNLMGVDQYNAVTDILADLGLPVIMDCPFGHVAPMMPLILGARISVQLAGDDLKVKMKI